MMTELSLHILDVAENSARAGASLVAITVETDTRADRLSITLADDGKGMGPEELSRVTDPFFTTRTTRKVGLGIPFFKYAAESAGGAFSIDSSPGRGTTVAATFGLTHIDRMPLGDMDHTIQTLIICHPDMDFVYTYRYDGTGFSLDTRQFREILGEVPLNAPEVSDYILSYLEEGRLETDGGVRY